MSEGTTLYCGDNCNHTGPHQYPPKHGGRPMKDDRYRLGTLDVERLARAIERSEAAQGLSPHIVPGGVAQVYLDSAARIAAEYARLAEADRGA